MWRYGLERDALWRRVVEVNCGNEWKMWGGGGRGCTSPVLGPYGVSLWRNNRHG